MKRGPKSREELTVIRSILDARPQPPEDLSEAQAETWRTIVNRLPHDWFGRETLPILAAHCRHVSTHKLLSDAIDQFEPDWLKVEGGLDRLVKLTAMRDRETRGMVATARALRLTKSAQIRPETAGRAARNAGSGARPWDWQAGGGVKV